MQKFKALGISNEIIRALNEMGFEEPTPIQLEGIPVLLEGKDLIGQAQTGTGKTAAFGIPLIEKVKKHPGMVQGIVLTPTRELAIQVAEELNRIGQFTEIHALPIYGGQDIQRQIKALKRHPQIIVATPGRLMDHMRRGTIKLQDTQMVVLDEADEMLNMGFIEDIEQILSTTSDERQTLLFSATMPRPIQNLAQRFLHDPALIKIKAKEITIPLVEQHYMEINDRQKFDVLCRLLDIQSPELSIVFGRTKRRVDEVSEALKKRGYSAEGIHGDLTQSKRDAVLRQFREGIVDILVATDVAARGLDVSGVTHVYNFDLPQDPESYVHRIGRTGRAGQPGLALTFVISRELEHLHSIEQTTKRKILRMPVPTMADAVEGQQRLTVEKLLNQVEEGNYDHYKGRAEELLTEMDSVSLLAAALKMLTKESHSTPVKITEELPVRVRTYGGNRRPSNAKKVVPKITPRNNSWKY
ncbi:MAG TPA: DEAD/DEAH box helicase [Methylomusa anaerophila]|uniref:ATP-dependent RNA helicase CshA n=1 Tax=Methylomusa anaerophila TaxID=1930071 RepID=A0A348AHE5_9FIRM|nr:DEAD/DEAH box helicase [Methylomusa anaerophila]BBB90493.1 DEAD-box ATP-dependent RNA helicase CshA [Methylomusa anaerophila]HML89865.1 DEAD/DEAH box helicase [Methylomusa anaerophila]